MIVDEFLLYAYERDDGEPDFIGVSCTNMMCGLIGANGGA